MTATITQSPDEARVRSLIDEHARAIRSKDSVAALAAYAADTVNFDLPPPLRFVGAQALDPKGLDGWFETWDGPIGIEYRDLAVEIGDGLAFAHGLLHLTGLRTDGEQTDVWVRQTFGLRRARDGWRIAHEHTSAPFYMDGSYRAAVDLTP